MNVTKTHIEGLLILEPTVFADERGYFFESFRQLPELPIFIQDNQSLSKYGTIRGLHMQKQPYSQAKLVRVLKGKVLDVAVDVRPNSPTYGKYLTIELSEENKKQLFIPENFLHGFSVLSDEAVFFYKVNKYYNKESETGVVYNDQTLNIDWKISNPIVSEKDKTLLSFLDFK